jgi:hypothetical protein
VPPMHYLASWRIQVATQTLRNTSIACTGCRDCRLNGGRIPARSKKAFGAAPAA